jgi:two-component system CheB/CheR fusion protein
MAREGLQLELRTALHLAATQNAATLNRQVSVKTNGDFQNVNLSVRSLPDPAAARSLLLVSFQDMAQLPVTNKRASAKRLTGPSETRRVEELEHELAYTKENLQATIEEQQASNEELKSTNEELQSTNEELQSTNEELQSTNEELQSTNEELVTVNAELQAKIELLASMQNDMKNLLDNINIGTIFLDQNLRIRRFTREAARVYRLVSSDVGRPLADIKPDLADEDLLADARRVLDTLTPYEREVRSLHGDWYLARIQPYRTLDNVIDGVVLTFADISKRVSAEQAVQAQVELAEGIVDTMREPLVVLDESLRVVSASRSFYRDFQAMPQDTIGRPLFELGNRQWDIPALRELLANILSNGQSFDDFVVEHDFPAIGRRKMLLNARRIIGKNGETRLILLAMERVRG